jgi:hypothetical protein
MLIMLDIGIPISWRIMTEAGNPIAGFDTSVPSPARMYDYWLGGKDNFAADREAAELSARAVPQLPWLARENRDFLRRAVRFCAQQGISQFLDIGSGLPTMDNVHQVAQRVTPDARVVYVDVDPVVVRHAQALLSNPHTTAIRGDVISPEQILAAPELRARLDFAQPAALLIVAVLHFVPNEDDPYGCVARLVDAMAPGSYLVISHVEVSEQHAVGYEPISQTARDLAEARRGMPGIPARTRTEIERFFSGLSLVEPGLTDVWAWRPEAEGVATPSEFMTVLGAVARKP